LLFRYVIFLWIGFFLVLFNTTAKALQCDSILKEGIFKTEYLKSSLYGKYILLAKLAHLSKKEADELFAANGIIPIEGFPVGVGYSTGQFNKWKEQVKQKINVKKITGHTNSIYVSEAGKNNLEEWLKCMEMQRGLVIRLESVDRKRAFLKVKWLPYDLMNPRDTIIIPKLLKGARPSPAGRHLKVGHKIRLKHHQEVTFPLRLKKGEPLWVVIEAEDSGKAAEVYLPPIVDLPPIPSHLRVRFNYECAGLSGETMITIPGEFVIYNQPGSSHPGFDVAECHVTEEGFVQAYNHDSCCTDAAWGPLNKERSLATHGSCTAECTVLGTYPEKKR